MLLPPGMRVGFAPVWHFFRCVFAVGFRWRIYNAGRVPRNGPFILASNHASLLDPPVVGSACPREISYLARESLFRFPVVGGVLKWCRAIPVDREGGGAAGLKGILDRLKAGGGILLFPEGTRTRDGRLQPARSGVGLAVLKSSAPVVPVRVFGTFEAMDRTARWPKPHRIQVKFGPPLRFAELRVEARGCSKTRLKGIYQEVADQIMAGIARLEPWEDKEDFP